jgi:tetratricopeptide (TPR) repeat protein
VRQAFNALQWRSYNGRLVFVKLFQFAMSAYRSHDPVPDGMKHEINGALSETKKKNFPVAVNIYKRIIPDYPDSAILRNNLGCCLAILKEFDEAETEFLEAIRLSVINYQGGNFIPLRYPDEPKRNLAKLYKMRQPAVMPADSKIGFIRNKIKRGIKSLKREGLMATCKKVPLFLYSSLNPLVRWQEKALALRAEKFDRFHNITTTGVTYHEDLGMNIKNQSHATYYRGSDSLFFNNTLSTLKINFRDYTFIDYGSGKGKALFLASEFSFKKTIGIEFSQVLDAAAQENIRQFKNNAIEAFCMDAVDFKIPNEPLVCYFYDPFDEYIMAKVIGNLRNAYAEYKKNIIVIYNNSRFYHLFDKETWLLKVNNCYSGSLMIWTSKDSSPR